MSAALVLAAVLAADRTVSGTVVDDVGHPVPNAEVRWADATGGHYGAGGDGLYAQGRAQTDEAGRFTLRHLPAVPVLEAHAQAHLISHDLLLDPHARAPFVLVVTRVARVRGRLVFRDQPVRGAELTFRGFGFVNDDDGHFDFALWPGDEQVVIDGPNLARRVLSLTTRPGEVRDLGDVALQSGTSLELVLMRGATRAKLALAMVPLSRAEELQRLAQADPERWRALAFSSDPWLLVGARFPHLAPGDYVVWTSSEPDLAPTKIHVGDAPQKLTLEAAPPAVLDVSADPSVQELFLDCGGHIVGVKLEHGEASEPVAPGHCFVPAVQDYTLEKGERELSLVGNAHTQLRVRAPKDSTSWTR